MPRIRRRGSRNGRSSRLRRFLLEHGLTPDQVAIQSLTPHQLLRRAVLHDPSGLQDDDAVERLAPSRADARSRSRFGRASASRARRRIVSSDSLSSAEVASSNSSSGASFRNARAIAMRWRWPPDSFTPRSPTMVAMPLGRASMKSHRAAAAACQHFLVGGARPPVADVLHDRAMEHRDVLRHDGDRGAQALLRYARDVLPVDQDASMLHVVEALQQRKQRRLPAA